MHAGADVYGADFTNALVDRTMQIKLCRYADGVNPTTGADTRKSLGCGSRRAFRVRAACCALSGKGLFCNSELFMAMVWALYHNQLNGSLTVLLCAGLVAVLARWAFRIGRAEGCLPEVDVKLPGLIGFQRVVNYKRLSVLPMSVSAGHSASVHTHG